MNVLQIYNRPRGEGGEYVVVQQIHQLLSKFPNSSTLYFDTSDWTGPDAPPKWKQALWTIYNPQSARRLLDEVAPGRIRLPGGRQVRVHYEPDQPPWIASRMQDFFGMRETPAVARGAVPVVVRLLAPNQRPVQMTSDLAGFWQRLYPQVRKELSRRYPKHAWPENPLK